MHFFVMQTSTNVEEERTPKRNIWKEQVQSLICIFWLHANSINCFRQLCIKTQIFLACRVDENDYLYHWFFKGEIIVDKIGCLVQGVFELQVFILQIRNMKLDPDTTTAFQVFCFCLFLHTISSFNNQKLLLHWYFIIFS